MGPIPWVELGIRSSPKVFLTQNMIMLNIKLKAMKRKTICRQGILSESKSNEHFSFDSE